MFFIDIKLFFYCAIFFNVVGATEISNRKNNFLSSLEERIENGVSESVKYLTKKLETFNDEHLGETMLGSQYRYLKTKLQPDETSMPRRKVHSAMLPLVFQVGATSTWMLLTALLTAKSVAIGLILLVFKIAVSSAKVSAFFTAWKQKHHHDHSYHDHGHFRSLNLDDHSSYFPEWHEKEEHTPSVEWNSNPYHYKTLPSSYNTIQHTELAYKSLPTGHDLSNDDEPTFKNLESIYDEPEDSKTSFESSATSYDAKVDAKTSFKSLAISYDPSEGTKNSYDSLATSYNPSGNTDGTFSKNLATGFDDSSGVAEPYGGYEYADEEDLKNDILENRDGERRSGGSTETAHTRKASEAGANIVYPCKDCDWHVPLTLKN